MNQSIVEIILGILVLIVTISGIFFFFNYTKGIIVSENTIKLIASFDQANGLKDGSLVKISGISVGLVESLELNKTTFEARVSMLLDGDLRIPQDTEAAVETDGIFGETFITLVPGGSDEYLSSGEEIFLTQGASSLLSLLSTFIN